MIVAIANQKGGTGKTTTTINLAAALNEREQQVLVVDLDPQGGATLHAGLKSEYLDRTIWTALKTSIQGTSPGATDREPEDDLRSVLNGLWTAPSFDPAVITACIIHRPNDNEFDLIPANLDLSEGDLALVTAVNRERHLSIVLQPLRTMYDYILIDCPPHLGLLTINGLTAADAVLIPLQTSYLSTRGMNQLFRVIRMVRQTLNYALTVQGVLLTMVDHRTAHSPEMAQAARDSLAGTSIRVFQTEIPVNVALSDASTRGGSALRFDTRGRGAQAYRQLAKEILAHEA
jgi:chromosome partitioning protein